MRKHFARLWGNDSPSIFQLTFRFVLSAIASGVIVAGFLWVLP
ncbi:hypothetical protein [Bordetella bronchiseptica]|nr:hypothetical protein [Bordetella bronchiseptica]KDC15250.1 hypothetical protein L542_2116 [Bordetella bronchiseptica F-1]KDC29322.1 hypothetical protein L504_2143 [Bordetella bronchiseptica F2]